MESKHKILIFARKGSIHHAEEIASLFPENTIVDHAWKPAVIDQEQPDLVITFDEHYCELALCVIHAKRKGIPMLLIRDGILETRFLDFESNEITKRNIRSTFISDKIACLGENDKKIIESWGNEGKCEAVGSGRIDRIISNYPIKKKPGASPQKRSLLIVSAKRPYFNEKERDITLKAFSDLKNTLAAYKDVLNVRWRVTSEIARKLSLKGKGFKETTGKELHFLLSQSDLVITTPSTSMLEAMLFGMPVAVIDYHNLEQLYKASWVIRQTGEIKPTLDQMISGDEDKLKSQWGYLNEQLNIEPTSQTRLHTLIKRMMNREESIVCPDELVLLRVENRALLGVNHLLEKQNRILLDRLHRIPFYNLFVRLIKSWKK